MDIFDLANPGVKVIKSTFGGGWAIPLDAAGTQALHEFYGEPVAQLTALGGEWGYIVEPHQSADLAEHLRGCNVAWTVEP